MLFSNKSNAQCNFSLSSNNTYATLLSPGTEDTLWRGISTCGCGGVLLNMNCNYLGTLAPYIGILKLYRNGVQVILWNTTINTVSLSLPMTQPDTSEWTITGEIDSLAPIGATGKLKVSFTMIDSNLIQYNTLGMNGSNLSVVGCAVVCKKNAAFPNQNISPDTSVKIGSFVFKNIGICPNLPLVYVTINNIGNVANTDITNMKIKKDTTQIGSTIPILGANSTIVCNENILDSVVYDVYADISVGVSSWSEIKLTIEGFSISTLPIDTGQTITFVSPSCNLLAVEAPTPNTLPAGNTVCLGQIQPVGSTCTIVLDSMRYDVYGTAYYGNVAPVYVVKNSTFLLSNTMLSAMSYTQTFLLNDTITGIGDIFAINGTLKPNSMNDVGKTFQGVITLYGHQIGGGIKSVVVSMATKTIINPSGVSNILESPVVLFPNPTNEYISFSGLKEATEIMICDVSGRTVVKKFVSNKDTIDVRSYPKGIYFIKSKTWTEKFVVQ